jgi:hypothetical protein
VVATFGVTFLWALMPRFPGRLEVAPLGGDSIPKQSKKKSNYESARAERHGARCVLEARIARSEGGHLRLWTEGLGKELGE